MTLSSMLLPFRAARAAPRWLNLSMLPWLALCFALLLVSLMRPAHAEQEFLDPAQAFVVSAQAADDRSVGLLFKVTSGYYLYREHFQFEADGATLGEADLPKGTVKFDQTFQKNVETYHGDLSVKLPVKQASGPFTLRVVYQGCAEAGLCYPPQTLTLKVALKGFGGDGSVQVVPDVDAVPDAAGANSSAAPDAKKGIDLQAAATATPATSSTASPSPAPVAAAPVNEGNRVQALLQGGSLWAVWGAFWLMGLLLAFTPCVLPMLPILSSIIAGGGATSRARGFGLALAYSLGMAMIYTALGVAAGLAGEGLAAALQKPWVLMLFGLLLAGFSLSMFDVYELRLPSSLAGKLDGASRSLPGGKLVGVFLMGGLSALIVSPCVTAPLAGTLLFLSQTHDVLLAGSALFALAVGMSTPLLILGASAGAWLPRSGNWMNVVKHFFGLLLLAVALWIVQPVLPPALALVGWAALLLVTGFMLRPFDASPHSAAPRVWLQRAAGAAALVYGVLLLIGAASGGRDALQPLAHIASGRAAGAAEPPAEAGLPFQPIRSVAELDQALKTAGRPVMLDFYADWCVSCKEMERFTFSDAAVRSRLAGALLLKADVTANSADDKALLKRFQLFGPPGTIFFDRQGRELAPSRIIGFQDAPAFLRTLTGAGL
ncbi:MAG TPA: protein-disulfide reductase DsbD [Ideonella sp.]|uniref:protein-disulfide reductase DsbD n=1 Tax=Ideonella sp. TaxID=1929293 RepID=UPI002B9EF70D|nr:protein-disulfide reductase DsbD [Ideonella sp.]HSI50073.1 protein-disulfide reductase DsbD [Ideonella sp.]